MASSKDLKIIQQAKKEYDLAKKNGDTLGMKAAHLKADKARGATTTTKIDSRGNYYQSIASAAPPIQKSVVPNPSQFRNASAETKISKEQQVKNQATALKELQGKNGKAASFARGAAKMLIDPYGLTNKYENKAQLQASAQNQAKAQMIANPRAVAMGLQSPKKVDVKIGYETLGGVAASPIGVDPLAIAGEKIVRAAIGKLRAKGIEKIPVLVNGKTKFVDAPIQKNIPTSDTRILPKAQEVVSKNALSEKSLQNVTPQIAKAQPDIPAQATKSTVQPRNSVSLNDFKKDLKLVKSDTEFGQNVWEYKGKRFESQLDYSGKNRDKEFAYESYLKAQKTTIQPEKPKLGIIAPKEQPFVKNTENVKAANIAENIKKDNIAMAAPKGQQVRGFSENVATDKSMGESLQKEFADKPETYEVLSNADTLKRAEDMFSSGEVRDSYDAVMKAIASNSLKPEHVPLARKVANQLAKDGDVAGARSILSEISVKLTESGQFSQAARILRNSDPMAVLQFIQKTIDKTNEGLKRRFKNFEGLKLTDEEVQRLASIDTGDEETIKQAVEDIGKRLAKEIPSSMFEKFDELRRIAMLGNFKTQARNVVGNVPLALERKLSNKVSAVGQKFLPKEQRTQALFTSKESRNIAKQLYASDKDWLTSTNKWDTNDIRKILNEERQVFNQSLIGRATGKLGASEKVQNVVDKLGLEGIRKLVYGSLELGDSPFLKSAYVDRMASYISSQGYKSLDEVPQKAIDLARDEALKATFRDANSFASFINKQKGKGGVLGKTIEATMPFVTTPSNLVRRTIDYSPYGLFRSIAKMKNAEDVPKIIDEMAQGLTGTALIGLGAYLAQNGIFVGAADDNKNKAAFEKMTGKQQFSIETPFGSISYDWAQPFGSQLAIATEMYKAYHKAMQDKGTFTYKDFADAALQSGYAGIDVILQSSVYQNVLDLFNGFGSAGERITQNIAEYPQQIFPTLLGQTARSQDPYIRNAFDKTGKLNTAVNNLIAKTPGKSETLPIKYDVWGRPMKRLESTGLRTAQEFINPANVSIKNQTPLDKEILKLYEKTGSNDVFPRTAPYNFKVGEKQYYLDNKGVSEYQKVMGQYAEKETKKLFGSAEYKKMSDDEKLKALNSIYSDASTRARMNHLKDNGESPILLLSDSKQKSYNKISHLGVNEDTYINTYFATKGINGVKDDVGNTIRLSESYNKKQAIDKANPNASPAELRALYHAFDISEKVW